MVADAGVAGTTGLPGLTGLAAPESEVVLVGREAERATIERLLASARNGQSGLLAVTGPPGSGKSALLDDAQRSAVVAGMRVLRARGIQSEATIPFSGLLEIVRPLLDHLRDLPPFQATVIESALALRPARGEDRFAVGAATLSLLAAAAEDRPMLVVVDDAHWVDGSTAGALLFACRRLVADPIAVVFGIRDDEPSLLDGADVPVLALSGLDVASAAELLATRTGRPLAADLVRRLHRHTGGNPLAMIELAEDESRVERDVPIDTPPSAVTSVAQAYVRRIRALPPSTRQALLLAAATDSEDLVLIGRAAACLPVDIAALEPAESERLVTVADGRLGWRHPMFRSAVYGSADPAERRACHRAIASVLPDAEADRRAWHLGLGVVGPDDAASSALAQAGARARDRSAYVVASRAFERAADLTESSPRSGSGSGSGAGSGPGSDSSDRRAGLLYAAAECAWSGGLPERTTALLDAASACGPEVGTAVAVEHLRGQVAARLGSVGDGQRILAAGAELASQVDPDRAIVMLAELVNAGFYRGDPAAMRSAAERIGELSDRLFPSLSLSAASSTATPTATPTGAIPSLDGASRRTAFFATAARGMALTFAGSGVEGTELLRVAEALIDHDSEYFQDSWTVVWTAMIPIWLREEDASRVLIDRAVEVVRQRAAIGVLTFLLSHVAIDRSATDRWSEAEAGFYEVISLARETGQRSDLVAALSRLALLEARQGREELCRAHATEALELSSELGLDLGDLWASVALGDLELGLGHTAEATEHYSRVVAILDHSGIGDVDLFPGPELVELALRSGRRSEAAEMAVDYRRRAEEKGQPWGLARAARAEAAVAGDDEMDPLFSQALELHARTPDLFEQARTRLAYGARLRRARQRVRAREQLRAAVSSFDHLGALVWAEQARNELAATGETARQRNPSTRDQLTPQELQIALVLADGHTTREAAASLFLSPKTIEYHLRSVYRKLGIGTRDELSAAMRQREADPD